MLNHEAHERHEGFTAFSNSVLVPTRRARCYTQAFKNTSFRQGLPESRAQGCEFLI
jgi:hypothetical protein